MKGTPRPSFAPLSATMMSRTWRGTCDSAKRPLVMLLARTGSVAKGVAAVAQSLDREQQRSVGTTHARRKRR
jgi:hypothetical protein